MELYIVDAFTQTPFAGNSAAVVLLAADRDAAWMQSVARELNHPETAFVTVAGGQRAGDPLPLRWFTPTVEVPLCGHATLASAHVIGGNLTFSTKSGLLRATPSHTGRIELDFPATLSTVVTDKVVSAELKDSLPGVWVNKISRAGLNFLVELANEQQVRDLVPDFASIELLSKMDPTVQGVIVTARATSGADFVSRYFAPVKGIPEDPVTGGAHCALAPYWSQIIHSNVLIGSQVSARGGIVHTTWKGDRVLLGGHAVTIAHGALTA